MTNDFIFDPLLNADMVIILYFILPIISAIYIFGIAPRKKTIKDGKGSKGKTSTTKVKRRTRKVKRKKLRKKAVCCGLFEHNLSCIF